MELLSQEVAILLGANAGQLMATNDDGLEYTKWMLAGQYERVLAGHVGEFILKNSDSNGPLSSLEEYAKQIEASVGCYLETSQDGAGSASREFQVLCVGVSCLQLYVQNNWVGPSSEKDPASFIPEHLSAADKESALSESLLQYLSVNGEPVYSKSTHLLYLFLARTILHECRHLLASCHSAAWWCMRCLQTQQALLEERSPQLKASIKNLIDEVSRKEPLVTRDEYSQLMIQFYLEAGHLLYFYYEPSEAKEWFGRARKVSNLSAELTGVLGKRTRFQQSDLPQLVLKVERLEIPANEKGTSVEIECTKSEDLPKNVALEDESVMNEMKFVDEDQVLVTSMSDVEQAMILALCTEHRMTHEGVGDILQEESLAYINCVLSQPKNWCVQSTALLQRTLWQRESARRMERSLAQLEEVVNQYKRDASNVAHRLHLIYCVKFPTRWKQERELAKLLITIGAMNAALDIFLRLQLWEDVIQCYMSLGRPERAEKTIREQLAIKETPALWCFLGDVLKDEKYYQKSWELSNCRFSRAQRSMGYLHLTKGQFEECLKCFEKTLELNPLQIGVWFSYGCASLALKKYDEAAQGFRRCVTIESNNFEAWNNLATAYIRSGQKPRAFVALHEALKCDYENWRIWENLLLVSTDCGQFEEVIRAYHRLLDIKHKYTDVMVLEVLVRAINEGIEDARGESASKLRNSALELFGRLTSKVTSEADVWRCYAKLILESPDKPSREDSERALQYLQKCHRCTVQKPSWEKELPKCKEVAKQSLSLAKTYLTVSEMIDDSAEVVKMLSSARLMLKGTLTKIKQTHSDPLTKEMVDELSEPCADLEAEIQKIIDKIAELRDS